MSRQLLSELLHAQNSQKQSFGTLNQNKSDFIPQQNQLNNDYNNHNHFNQSLNQITNSNREFIPQVGMEDSNIIDTKNINNLVNQSNLYWRQERKMFDEKQKLSSSIKSDYFDSSRRIQHPNDNINTFNSYHTEIKTGKEDIPNDTQKFNKSATINDIACYQSNQSYENSKGGNSGNITNYSLLDFQLNASQQEYVKIPSKSKNQITTHQVQIPNQMFVKPVNLENILANIDSDSPQKHTKEINQSNYKDQNNIHNYVNTSNQRQQINNSNKIFNQNEQFQSEQYQSTKRSVSIDNQFRQGYGGNQYMNQQNRNFIRLSSQEITSTKGKEVEIIQSQQQYNSGSQKTASIKNKSDCNIEDTLSQRSQTNRQASLLNKSQGEEQKINGEINSIGKTTNKQILSINSQTDDKDRMFVFCYTRKQATCFPIEMKLNSNYLEVLELSFNRFKIFPEEIAQFTNLKRIKIDNNFIRTIPVWLFNTLQLVEFSISNNLIQEIPINIQNQQNLISLDFSQNRISHIHQSLTTLKQLQYLNLSNNEFTFLPFSFKNLIDNNLKELALDWFKYCNPPLSQTQIHLEHKQLSIPNKYPIQNKIQNNFSINQNSSNVFNNSNFPQNQLDFQNSINFLQNCYRSGVANGGETISPLKKLSQLLFKAQQQQQPMMQNKNSIKKHIPIFQQQIKQQESFYTFEQFVNEMSSNGFRLNIRNFKGETLMHLAAASEDIGVIESLNKIDGTMKNECDQNNHTPLSLSISEEKYFAAKKLLQLNCDANLGGGIYGSPLNIATIKGQIYLIQDILSKNVNVNVIDVDGNSSIHYIMTVFQRDILNSTHIASLLLNAGGNPNIKNKDSWTPLHLAIKRSCYQAVEFAKDYNKKCLLEYEQKQNKQQMQAQKFSILNEQSTNIDYNKQNSIDSMNEKSNIKTNLISQYCKPPFKVGQIGSTNDNDNQQILVQKKFQLFDFSSKGGPEKWSCLHICCYNNDYKMAKILLEVKETDFFSQNKWNQIPLALASKSSVLSKLMKLFQKQLIFKDLDLKEIFRIKEQDNSNNKSHQINSTNQKLNSNKGISNKDQNENIDSIQTDTQVSECQRECQIKNMNESYSKGPSGFERKDQKQQNKEIYRITNQPELPDYASVASILANLTSPQENPLPFHLNKKKYIKLQIQSKNVLNQDTINFDEDEEQNNQDYLIEFHGQTSDDFNTKDIDENNQIKETMKSREGNMIDHYKKRLIFNRNSNRICNTSFDYSSNSQPYNNKRFNSQMNVANSYDQNHSYSIQQSNDNKNMANNTSYYINQSKPSQKHNPQSKVQTSFDKFSQKLCNLQETNFIEEQSEILIIKPEIGFTTAREKMNHEIQNKNQIGRVYNSDTKQANRIIQENSFNNIKYNGYINSKNNIDNMNDQSQFDMINQMSSQRGNVRNSYNSENQYDKKIPQENSAEKHSKQSIKDQKKLNNNLLRYSHDDNEDHIFCIPKLYSGENRQAIIFQTIQNIFSLYVSGTIQYKKSLIETVQSISDKYKQIVIILKLYIETHSQMEAIQLENMTYLPQINASQYSIHHIKLHAILLLQDLLFSINTTPINYKTLMRFVEDQNEEFQENLLLLRQSKDSQNSLNLIKKFNNPMPVMRGDQEKGSSSPPSTNRSESNINLQLKNNSPEFVLNNSSNQLIKLNTISTNVINLQTQKTLQTNNSYNSQYSKLAQINNIEDKLKDQYSMNDQVIEDNEERNEIEDQVIKEQNMQQQDIFQDTNLLIKEYLMSSLLKIDNSSSTFESFSFNNYQSQNQNIILQYESVQSECYFSYIQQKELAQQIKQNNFSSNQFSTNHNYNTNANMNTYDNNTDQNKLNTEQSINYYINPNHHHYKPPIYVKKKNEINNNVKQQQIFQDNENSKSGVRSSSSSFPYSKINVNHIAGDSLLNQSSSNAASTMNTSSATRQTNQRNASFDNNQNIQHNLKQNKMNIFPKNNQQIQTNQTNTLKEDDINLNNKKISNIISDNQIFSYPKQNNTYNGYFNNQVLQQNPKLDNINSYNLDNKNTQQLIPNTKKPQIFQNNNNNRDNSISEQISNLISSQQRIESQQNNETLKRDLSQESFFLNENLENSFLNDEAIIGHKSLNTQVNKFLKYK